MSVRPFTPALRPRQVRRAAVAGLPDPSGALETPAKGEKLRLGLVKRNGNV
jgi:hypothetical protein